MWCCLICAACRWPSPSVFTKGVAEQIPAIEASIQAGIAKIQDRRWASRAAAASPSRRRGRCRRPRAIVTGLKGLTGFLVSSIDSLVSLFFGVFIATMVFFLVLLNPKESQGWIARLLPWPREQADRLFSTSGQVIFDYYKGCTILACVNAFPIWLVAPSLDIKAAGAIFVVLFVSSYIPYIGAWIGGAFAVVDGGVPATRMLGGSCCRRLIVNLGLQSAVQPFAFGATMNVSPLGVFLFTLLGVDGGRCLRRHHGRPRDGAAHAVQHRCAAPPATPAPDPDGWDRDIPRPSRPPDDQRDGLRSLRTASRPCRRPASTISGAASGLVGPGSSVSCAARSCDDDHRDDLESALALSGDAHGGRGTKPSVWTTPPGPLRAASTSAPTLSVRCRYRLDDAFGRGWRRDRGVEAERRDVPEAGARRQTRPLCRCRAD